MITAFETCRTKDGGDEHRSLTCKTIGPSDSDAVLQSPSSSVMGKRSPSV